MARYRGLPLAFIIWFTLAGLASEALAGRGRTDKDIFPRGGGNTTTAPTAAPAPVPPPAPAVTKPWSQTSAKSSVYAYRSCAVSALTRNFNPKLSDKQLYASAQGACRKKYNAMAGAFAAVYASKSTRSAQMNSAVASVVRPELAALSRRLNKEWAAREEEKRLAEQKAAEAPLTNTAAAQPPAEGQIPSETQVPTEGLKVLPEDPPPATPVVATTGAKLRLQLLRSEAKDQSCVLFFEVTNGLAQDIQSSEFEIFLVAPSEELLADYRLRFPPLPAGVTKNVHFGLPTQCSKTWRIAVNGFVECRGQKDLLLECNSALVLSSNDTIKFDDAAN